MANNHNHKHQHTPNHKHKNNPNHSPHPNHSPRASHRARRREQPVDAAHREVRREAHEEKGEVGGCRGVEADREVHRRGEDERVEGRRQRLRERDGEGLRGARGLGVWARIE